MKQTILLFTIATFLFACNSNTNITNGDAYIGGEVINPNSDYLVLRDANHAIDTLYLDDNNRFSYQTKGLTPGLYSFFHGGERQAILIEPNDSILIRLNTQDFDESLVFSGTGAKKNNFLIDLFLTNESESQSTFQYYKLEPKAFQLKLDSIRHIKYAKLDKFNSKYQGSKLFQKISKATINYSYYDKMEQYHSRHFGNNKPVNHDMFPSDFYNFRQTIDYNDNDLEVFHLYNNFLFPHFNNLALDKYFDIHNESPSFNRNNLEYNLIKLKLMDSLLHNESIKNNFLFVATLNFLDRNSSNINTEEIYNSFLAKSSNENHIKKTTKFYNTTKRLQSGSKLPNIEIVDIMNKSYNISDIITNSKKPTLIYFWRNAYKPHFLRSHKKADRLREDFPNINFIAINIDGNSSHLWKHNLRQNQFDMAHEYKFRNPEIAIRLFAINLVNKVMIIDADNTIINSGTNMFSNNLTTILEHIK